MMLVLVVITMLAAMTTGSGNAPFYAFVELIETGGADGRESGLSSDRCCKAQLGRTLSPVSGVVVAVSGWRKSPFEVVKRTSVPVIVGLVVVIVATELLAKEKGRAMPGLNAKPRSPPVGRRGDLHFQDAVAVDLQRFEQIVTDLDLLAFLRHTLAVFHQQPRQAFALSSSGIGRYSTRSSSGI